LTQLRWCKAMLNTLTEHDFQDAVKIWQSAGDDGHVQKVTTSRVMVASRLKDLPSV
jgi:hypothetical protein